MSKVAISVTSIQLLRRIDLRGQVKKRSRNSKVNQTKQIASTVAWFLSTFPPPPSPSFIKKFVVTLLLLFTIWLTLAIIGTSGSSSFCSKHDKHIEAIVIHRETILMICAPTELPGSWSMRHTRAFTVFCSPSRIGMVFSVVTNRLASSISSKYLHSISKNFNSAWNTWAGTLGGHATRP